MQSCLTDAANGGGSGTAGKNSKREMKGYMACIGAKSSQTGVIWESHGYYKTFAFLFEASHFAFSLLACGQGTYSGGHQNWVVCDADCGLGLRAMF